MARIRTVKPALFRHEALFELERATGLPLRVSFIGLFTCCDREGRFHWRPRELKLDILPYDEVDFSRVLDALWTRGFVVKYAIDHEIYGHIPTFSKHQVINNREAQSDIPSPLPDTIIDPSGTRDARDIEITQGNMEGKGREEEGKKTLEAKASKGADAPDGNLVSDKPEWWPKRDRYGRVVSEVTDKVLFDVGKAVLGKSAGGQITKMRKLYHGDMRAVTDLLLQADDKSDPTTWWAKILHNAEIDELTPAMHQVYPEREYRDQ